jgi:parallel beta-helix repeat protein
LITAPRAAVVSKGVAMVRVSTARRPSLKLLAVLITIATSLLIVPSPAHASVPCGTVVVADLTLTGDMVCPGVDALIVGADGVTIDLGGHQVVNTGGGTVSGVKSLGFDGVTVRNGTITDFYRNIHLEEAHSAVLEDIRMSGGGGWGVYSIDSDDLSVQNVRVSDVPDAGILVDGGDGAILRDVTARNTGWGIFIIDSLASRVERSHLSENYYGVYVYLGRGNVIADSTFRNNSTAGVASEFATKTEVHDSRLETNGIGLHYFGTSTGGRIEGNRIARNGIGVKIGFIEPFTEYPADGVYVVDNVIASSAASGIVVDQTVVTGFPHRIDGNHVIRNGNSPGTVVDSLGNPLDDGIHVIAPPGAAELIGNRTIRNADFGIYADVAADLGGNAGVANGNPAQCFGVIC